MESLQQIQNNQTTQQYLINFLKTAIAISTDGNYEDMFDDKNISLEQACIAMQTADTETKNAFVQYISKYNTKAYLASQNYFNRQNGPERIIDNMRNALPIVHNILGAEYSAKLFTMFPIIRWSYDEDKFDDLIKDMKILYEDNIIGDIVLKNMIGKVDYNNKIYPTPAENFFYLLSYMPLVFVEKLDRKTVELFNSIIHENCNEPNKDQKKTKAYKANYTVKIYSPLSTEQLLNLNKTMIAINHRRNNLRNLGIVNIAQIMLKKYKEPKISKPELSDDQIIKEVKNDSPTES